MKTKSFKKTVVLRAVNIPLRLVEPLSLMLHGEEIQFEFSFCEEMLDKQAKKLLDGVNNSDINGLNSGF